MSNNKAFNKIIQYGIDRLDNLEDQHIETGELHYHLYNEDYFIVGTNKARKFLEEFGTFEAIGIVTKHEKDNFGEVTTEIDSPEKLANMLAYVIGYEALQECETVNDNWDGRLANTDLARIKSELKEQLR